jgi:uncharacterized membrane protein
MARVERSIFINAPIEDIDAIALDGSRLPEWYEGVEETRPDATYPEVGGELVLVYKAAGLSFNITLTVLELVRGEHITYRMEGMMTGTQHWTHTPEDGGTRTAAVIEYEMPGGGLGKLADKLVVERMNASNLEKSLENLKALVES